MTIPFIDNEELERSIVKEEYISGTPTRYYILTVKDVDQLGEVQYEVRLMEERLLIERKIAGKLQEAKIEGIRMLLHYFPGADRNHFMMVHYKNRGENNPWQKDTNEQVNLLFEEIKSKLSNRLNRNFERKGDTSMVNLGNYQTIFDHNVTHERCQAVLEQIETPIKPIMQQFMDGFNDTNLSLHTYGVTLTTTYHDALNPKTAEQKTDSNIGRKYFLKIMRKIGDSEVNALSLEFNGMERTMSISVDSNFYPMWEAVRLNRLHNLLLEIKPEIDVLVSSQSKSSPLREPLTRNQLEDFIKSCIKPRKRPGLYFAKCFPLEGEWSEAKLLEELQSAWDDLVPVRVYLEEEKMNSVHAAHILNLIKAEDTKQDVLLFHKMYQLQYSSVEQVKSGVSRQQFLLKDQDQLIVKGYVVYYQYHEKQSPHQVLAVQLDGHNHIYTNVRQLLEYDKKPWWIRKLFATHSLNNAEILESGMALLKQHGIQAKENEYLVGTYDNGLKTFTEGAQAVKNKLITAALLFAHASEKLQLPTTEEQQNVSMDESVEEGFEVEEEEYTASFHLTSILELITNSRFTFHMSIIRDFHLNLTALDDKHLVILSGISGTGKTQLARLYANAVYGMEYEADNPYLSVIPVRPDWTDGSALFGYYSSFENRYVMPEFLRMVMKAHQERVKPHFIVLDEMNLARVEYYLSDYLSGVESRREIPLHNKTDLVDIPKSIKIPPNLYVIGTVNVDETTHTISDKVLDRAFVMTLNEVDFPTFWEGYNEEVKLKLQMEYDFLTRIHSILKPSHLHFGYRSMNEMLLKLSLNKELEVSIQMKDNEALEKVIIEKVFPKLRGDDDISDTLEKLRLELTMQFGAESVSVSIVKRMEKEITRYGAAQFWR